MGEGTPPWLFPPGPYDSGPLLCLAGAGLGSEIDSGLACMVDNGLPGTNAGATLGWPIVDLLLSEGLLLWNDRLSPGPPLTNDVLLPPVGPLKTLSAVRNTGSAWKPAAKEDGRLRFRP